MHDIYRSVHIDTCAAERMRAGLTAVALGAKIGIDYGIYRWLRAQLL